MKIKGSYILVISLVLLLGIAISMSFQSTYNRFNMVVKHMSFFLFFALLTFFIIKVMYKRFLRNDKLISDKSQLFLKLFTVLVFGGFIFGLSKIQLSYIDIYETPDLLTCSYYDEHGNRLYDSYFQLSCPTFEVMSNKDNEINLQGYESVEGYNRTYFADETRINGGDITSEILIDINVKYDDLGRIVYYHLNWTQTSFIETDTDIYSGYISLMKEVRNSYSEAEFISDQRNYQYEKVYQGSGNTVLNGHYDFTDSFYVQNKYIVDYLEGTIITNEYIDRNGEQGSSVVGQGSVSDDLINADFSSDTFYNDQVFVNTILTNVPTGIKQFKLMEPTYGALVYVNDYTDIDGLAVLINEKRSFAYGDYDIEYEIYPETSKGNVIIEGVFNLYKLVETQYGYRLEKYNYGYQSNDTWNDEYTSHLIVSPSLNFHIFEYLDYVDLLFDASKMDEHIIYPYNPILDHLTYYGD